MSAIATFLIVRQIALRHLMTIIGVQIGIDVIRAKFKGLIPVRAVSLRCPGFDLKIREIGSVLLESSGDKVTSPSPVKSSMKAQGARFDSG